MKRPDNMDNPVNGLHLTASPDLDARVHKSISDALAAHEETQLVPSKPIVFSTFTKGRAAGLAAAVLILTGVLVLTSVFVETNENVALAAVLERVRQAHAFTYEASAIMTGSGMPGGKMEVQSTTIICDEYGMKCTVSATDPNTGKKNPTEMYIFPEQKSMITLLPELKTYYRTELDDEWLTRLKRDKNDPREMLKQIMDCNYTELGRKEIDGVEVAGFETTDLEFARGVAEGVRITLWVDVETRLPVLWDILMKVNEHMQIHGVVSDFRWDIPVVASDFEPVIPDDFTLTTDNDDRGSSITGQAAPGREKSPATDHYERGEAHYFDGEYDQAFAELTRAIEIDPNLARAYVTRGMAYNDKSQFDLAIADFTRIIEIKPTDARAYTYRGMAYGNNGEYDLAIADYSKAIEMDPTITDAYRGRARIYTDKGEYDKAWKDVHEAQALGHPVDSRLLEELRKASGKDE